MKVLRTAIWNWRFHLGWIILPGDHKHVTTLVKGEFCPRCMRVI